MCKAPGGFNKPETRPPSSMNSQRSSECPGLLELSWNDLIFFHLRLWNKSLASLYPDLWSYSAFAGSFSVTNSVISEVKMPRPVYCNKLKTGFSSLSAWPVWGLEACGTGGGRLLCASFLARFLFLFCAHQSPFVTPPRLSSDREEMRGKAERIWRVTDCSSCGKSTKVTFYFRGVFSGRFLWTCSHRILMGDCSIFPSCDTVPILALPGVTLGQVLCSVGWGSWLPPPTWSISGSWEASCVPSPLLVQLAHSSHLAAWEALWVQLLDFKFFQEGSVYHCFTLRGAPFQAPWGELCSQRQPTALLFLIRLYILLHRKDGDSREFHQLSVLEASPQVGDGYCVLSISNPFIVSCINSLTDPLGCRDAWLPSLQFLTSGASVETELGRCC